MYRKHFNSINFTTKPAVPLCYCARVCTGEALGLLGAVIGRGDRCVSQITRPPDIELQMCGKYQCHYTGEFLYCDGNKRACGCDRGARGFCARAVILGGFQL